MNTVRIRLLQLAVAVGIVATLGYYQVDRWGDPPEPAGQNLGRLVVVPMTVPGPLLPVVDCAAVIARSDGIIDDSDPVELGCWATYEAPPGE